MTTYKIRTHNQHTSTLAILLFAILPLFFVVILPVNNGASLYLYLLNIYKVAPETIHNLPYLFPLYLFAIGVFCYYFICTINSVTISDEGVHATWYTKWYSFKKEERTIKWADMESFHPTGGTSSGFLTGFSISTTNNETFSFFCIYLFFKQRNFKTFIKDFEARYEEVCNKGSVAEKPKKPIENPGFTDFPDI